MKKRGPVNLKRIELYYDDGTVIRVPENQAMKVGTMFMKFIGSEGVEWEVVSAGKKKTNFFTTLVNKLLEI